VEGLSNRMKEEGQWIVLMGFLVSIGIFFLALILNQSTIVGQTTAEGVLEFPKNDLQDFRAQVLDLAKNKSVWVDPETQLDNPNAIDEKLRQQYLAGMMLDIQNLSLERKNAIVRYSIGDWDDVAESRSYILHYNNGVFVYNEDDTVPY
jgi:hypothetical protein